tara:strand:+ start:304 stop:678 length:375 start_codon:yes stop_codon:yes gene_type:complete
MSVSTHLDRAESALRKALINALAEGEDHLLKDLFENLSNIMDLTKKSKNIIRFTDNTDDYYYNKENDLNFEVLDGGRSRIGSDLDSLDNILQFPNISVTDFNEDIISFTPDPEFESRCNQEDLE